MDNEGIELSNCYIPKFLVERSLKTNNNFSKNSIFVEAEKFYGKLNFKDSEAFSRYISDLEEEGVLIKNGNYYKFNNETLLKLNKVWNEKGLGNLIK